VISEEKEEKAGHSHGGDIGGMGGMM